VQQAAEGAQASKRHAAAAEQQQGKRARVDQQLSGSNVERDQALVLQEQDIGWDDETEPDSRGDGGKALAQDIPAGLPQADVPISRPHEDYSPSRSLDVHALTATVHAAADAEGEEPLGSSAQKDRQAGASDDVKRAVVRFVRAILDPLHQCKVRSVHC
jgi:hypothetical protein